MSWNNLWCQWVNISCLINFVIIYYVTIIFHSCWLFTFLYEEKIDKRRRNSHCLTGNLRWLSGKKHPGTYFPKKIFFFSKISVSSLTLSSAHPFVVIVQVTIFTSGWSLPRVPKMTRVSLRLVVDQLFSSNKQIPTNDATAMFTVQCPEL